MAIALGLLWLGYGVGYYGWNRITGGNDSFVSLIWPGRYTPTARDGGSGVAQAAGSGAASAILGNNLNKNHTPGTGQTVPGQTVQPS